MLAYLVRKSLADFWDHFFPAALYNILSIGMLAALSLSGQWAGSFWMAGVFLVLAMWQIIAAFFIPWMTGEKGAPPWGLIISGAFLWSLILVTGCVALGFYWSSPAIFSWFLGFLTLWILLLFVSVFQLAWVFLNLGSGGWRIFKEEVLSLLLHPKLLASSGLLGLLSFLSLIIFFPGSSFGIFACLNARALIREWQKAQELSPECRPEWKNLLKPLNQELKNRSWISLIFPWRG